MTQAIIAGEIERRNEHRARGSGTRALMHGGMSVPRFFEMHVLSALFPLTAGIIFFGWRALIVMGGVIASTLIGAFIWRRIGARGRQMHLWHMLWLAVLLSMLLPSHLASRGSMMGTGPLWMMLPAAGLTLAAFSWLLGGVGSGRVHPVLLTYLLMVVAFGGRELVPHYVLQRSGLIQGDLLNVAERPPIGQIKEPWGTAEQIAGKDAIWREPASQVLVFYTSGNEAGWQTLAWVVRDRIPPLEDLIVGGQPAPLGCASAVAVIVGGLFLLYRGLIDFRIPLLMVASAFIGFMVLPIPAMITTSGAQWEWLVGRLPEVGWPLAITFANYEIVSGPLLLAAFFIATSPAIRPMPRRGRAIYAVLCGLLTAIFQLYASVAYGPYLAILGVSLLTPMIDKFFRPRALLG